MSIDRVRYQLGSVEFHAATKKYFFRYRDAERRRRSVFLGTEADLSTAAKLKRATEQMRAKVNAEMQAELDRGMLMNDLIAMYKTDRMPKRQSTSRGYLSKLKNHIVPRWGTTPVAEIVESAYEVELWLKQLDAAPKSKVHLRGLLSILIDYAMLKRVVPVERNPLELVRIEGASRRKREPVVLTYDQFAALMGQLREPYRTMTLLAGALGLRCSEIDGLRWRDIDFDEFTITLRQGVVNGREDELKTPKSKSVLPLSPEVAEALTRWKSETLFKKPTDWVFASPFMLGRKPYHAWSAQNQVLSPAGVRAGIGRLGWHDLRHSYRTWLDETGAPLWCAARIDAPCFDHDDYERLWKVVAESTAGGQRERCNYAAESGGGVVTTRGAGGFHRRPESTSEHADPQLTAMKSVEYAMLPSSIWTTSGLQRL